jgi:hypothetical protein
MRGTDGGAAVDVRYVLRLLALVFALFANAANSQSSGPSPRPAPGTQTHFVCNPGYSVELCRRQMEVLRGVLGRYPANWLGEWTWVLVRSEDWKPMKRRLRLDPDSPAFSYLGARRTFIEEALVTPVPRRSDELIKHWSSSIDDLLALAVSHELGHALCHERNEHKADEYGRLLRAGRLPVCR